MGMKNFQTLVDEGLAALDKRDTLKGLLLFEEAVKHQVTPVVQSCLGYCLAREKRQFREGVELCQQAKRKEPQNSLHHLNLGRIYLLAGHKQLAIKVFRQGMRMQPLPALRRELETMGVRREPVFANLDRNHPLNKHVGRLMARVGLR